jgi:uncharacterized phage protein gp47/JayE
MSTLVFDPAVGLAVPETAELRERIAAQFKAAFFRDNEPELDTDPSSPAGQLVDLLVAEIEAKNAELLRLANMFNPKVADGRWQDALGYIYFLNRKLAEPTTVSCVLTGLANTRIPYGILAEDSEGRRFMHNRLNVSLGENGTVETMFRSVQVGKIEVAPNSINRIVTTISGLDTIDNPEAGVPGRLLETRSDFEARRAESVAKNSHGSVASIYGSLHDLSGIAGVIDVQVLENIGPEPVTKFGVTIPGHGITVCIYGGNDADIARIIYEKKDAGCDTGGNSVVTHVAEELGNAVYEYNIQRPATVGFWVSVELGSSEILTPDLEDRIKKAVVNDFLGNDEKTANPRVGLASTVYASRFYNCITNIPVRNLLSVTIALGDSVTNDDFYDMIVIRGDQEPTLSEGNVIVSVHG